MSVPPIHARTVRPNGLAPADRTELKSRVEKKELPAGEGLSKQPLPFPRPRARVCEILGYARTVKKNHGNHVTGIG